MDFLEIYFPSYSEAEVADQLFYNFPQNTSTLLKFSEIFMETLYLNRSEIGFVLKRPK